MLHGVQSVFHVSRLVGHGRVSRFHIRSKLGLSVAI